MKKQIKSLTLKIPADVHKKLKLLSVQEDRSMTDILIECIEHRYESILGKE